MAGMTGNLSRTPLIRNFREALNPAVINGAPCMLFQVLWRYRDKGLLSGAGRPNH